jgi:hypothetical protein
MDGWPKEFQEGALFQDGAISNNDVLLQYSEHVELGVIEYVLPSIFDYDKRCPSI